MVKSCIHFITKTIVAVVVYILAFIAGILYLIDGLFRMISGAVSALPVACIGFLLSGAVTMTIYFFVGENAAEDVWTQTAIFWMWVVAIIATMLLAYLGSAVTSIALLVLTFINPGNLSGIISAAANVLSNWYMDLEKGEAEPWISIIAFPYAIGEWASLVFGFLGHVIAWVGTPAIFAWMAYSFFFTGPEAVAKGTPDFWISVVICVLMVIGGLVIGSAASLYLAAETAEE